MVSQQKAEADRLFEQGNKLLTQNQNEGAIALDLSILSDEAISRESIYGERGQLLWLMDTNLRLRSVATESPMYVDVGAFTTLYEDVG